MKSVTATSPIELNGPIVSPAWLHDQLGNPNLIVLDASMEKSVAGSPAAIEGCFIPGSIRFNFATTIKDQNSNLPHMLPSPHFFEQEVRKLGICYHHTIVVYGNRGTYASPRAWWMFQVMGHSKVAVLNGGIPQWIQQGLSTVSSLSEPETEGDFQANLQNDRVCDLAGVMNATRDSSALIVDARSAKRFSGEQPEPREGLRSGHIPTSCNIPFANVLSGHQLASKEIIQTLFAELTTDQTSRIVASCGSGVTACILALAAETAGYPSVAVYDGSWAEFGLADK